MKECFNPSIPVKYMLIHSGEFVNVYDTFDSLVEDFQTLKNPQCSIVLNYDGFSGKDISESMLKDYSDYYQD